MTQETQTEIAEGTTAPIQSEAPIVEAPAGVTDTPETVEETDEQRNARELAERKKRSERQYQGVKRRIDELTADKYAERQARERAEREAETLRSWIQQQQQAKQQSPNDGGPRRDQFDDYESYIAAKAEWSAEQRANQAVEQLRTRMAQEQAQAAQFLQAAQLAQAHQARVKEFAKANPAFAEVMDSDVDVGTAARAIVEMEDGPAVMLALHQNPEIAERLRASSPYMQGIILGQLSASLKSRPPVSKAPAPGTPVGSKPASTHKDPSQMTDAEFAAYRRRQIAQRGR